MYNVVTGISTIQEIKKCKYFKTKLGLASTKIERSGERVPNTDDEFSFFYNEKYRTPVYMQGTIGDINFYTDHYITDNSIYIFHVKEEFIFQYDRNMVREKGIEFYLGHLLKQIETENNDRIQRSKEDKINTKREANPDILTKSPGAVTYDDIKAYMEKKNKERFQGL
jgi:hypothetical protein